MPNEARKSFAIDDIPNGARTFWSLPNGRVVTDYVWKNGRPAPRVDREIVAQLDKIAGTLTTRGDATLSTNNQEELPIHVAEVLAGYAAMQKVIASMVSTEDTIVARGTGTARSSCE